MYIALVGWLFREFDIYPGLNLIAKIAKVIKFFYGATEWMKTRNATKITKNH